MGALDTLVYFMDHVCASHNVVHLVFGVFFGFLLGHAQPAMAFWSATGVGFIKETIDYFKHHAESASFNYLTDVKYGIVDGMGDLLFWMIGGVVVFVLLKRSHRMARATVLNQNLDSFVGNLANRDTRTLALESVPVEAVKPTHTAAVPLIKADSLNLV